ncbi:hypothetical protein BN2537_7939 [Streptomyces venezuelae]|nr:hypothetical protein BN2537_7939 [Streptomyces venezuelae]
MPAPKTVWGGGVTLGGAAIVNSYGALDAAAADGATAARPVKPRVALRASATTLRTDKSLCPLVRM